MTLKLAARNFAGGVRGGQAHDEQDGRYGMRGYCICGWIGPFRSSGGYNRYRSQSYRDYEKHSDSCAVANRKQPAPDWGTITHAPEPYNEVMHTGHSWRAKCACGWTGKLYWDTNAHAQALVDSQQHAAGRKPVRIGGGL